jgi:small multidrug resistance family-3 protein
VPIHIGGSSRAAARRAGRRGDGYFPGGMLTPQERAIKMDLARSAAIEAAPPAPSPTSCPLSPSGSVSSTTNQLSPEPRGHGRVTVTIMTVLRSTMLFVVAALAEIGGAWLVWQGVREHRGLLLVGAGVLALGAYGFVATFQPDPHFGRILAAYGGVFVAGSLAWGVILDGFRPDRFDLLGAALCLLGVVVIMYAPRAR